MIHGRFAERAIRAALECYGVDTVLGFIVPGPPFLEEPLRPVCLASFSNNEGRISAYSVGTRCSIAGKFRGIQ
jgi:hypothetical protein